MPPWYYLHDGQKVGPVDETALAELVQAGTISAAVSVRAEGEDFWSRLDERLPQLAGGMSPAQAEPMSSRRLTAPPGSSWTDVSPHPWRRYFARITDNLIVGTVTWTVIIAVAYIAAPAATARFLAVIDGPGGNLVDLMLTLMVAIPGNALIVGLTGVSIGKWIFGVKIVRPDGRPVGVGAALLRELHVWFRGFGFGIPLVSLITLTSSYRSLVDNRTAPWDRNPSLRIAVHRPAGALQTVLTIIGIPTVIACAVALRLLARGG